MSSALVAALLLAAKSLVVLAVVAGVAALLRRSSAASRHVTWTAGVVAVLALPVLAVSLPVLTVRAPQVSEWRLPGREAPSPGPIVVTEAPTTGSGSAAVDFEAAPRKDEPGARVSATSGSAGIVVEPGRTGLALPSPEVLLLLVWVLGVLVVGVRFAAQHLRLSALGRSLPAHHPELTEATRAVAREIGAPDGVRVLRGDRGTMPMTWGLARPKLLLPDGAEAWPAARLRQVLLHELAHVRRRDALTQGLAQLVCTLHWFDPLAWFAARRMREERELACDDIVLRAGTPAADYADQLVAIARAFVPAPRVEAVASAVAPKSQLEGRLHAMFDDRRPRSLSPLRAAGILALLVSIALPLAAVRLVTAGTWDDLKDIAGSLTIRHDDGSLSVAVHENGVWFQARAEGKVTFAADESDVTGLSPDGMFKVRSRSHGDDVAYEVERRGGDLVRTLEVDGDEVPLDAAGRERVRLLLQEFFRRSGYGAEERVKRIHRESGFDGVMTEIGEIESSHVAGRYLGALYAVAEPTPDQFSRMVRTATERMRGSDYELAQFLVAACETGRMGAEDATLVARAAAGMDSDYETKRTLTALLENGGDEPAVLAIAVEATADMDSDYETAEVLTLAASRGPIPAEALPAFAEAAAHMDSDYELKRVLVALLEEDGVDDGTLGAVLDLVDRRMDSDYESAEVLTTLARNHRLSGELLDRYVEVADRLDSDYESDRSLAALARSRGTR